MHEMTIHLLHNIVIDKSLHIDLASQSHNGGLGTVQNPQREVQLMLPFWEEFNLMNYVAV